MKFFKALIHYWIFVLLLVLLTYFGIANRELLSQEATIVLPFLLREAILTNVFVAVLGGVVLGASLTVLYFGLDHFKKTIEVRRLKKKVAELMPPAHSSQSLVTKNPEPASEAPASNKPLTDVG